MSSVTSKPSAPRLMRMGGNTFARPRNGKLIQAGYTKGESRDIDTGCVTGRRPFGCKRGERCVDGECVDDTFPIPPPIG